MPTPNQNPGTTPSGTEPQPQASAQPNNNPNPGAPPKLIAGKFKSVEEAVEQGYTGLERGYHQLTEQVGALTRVLEAAMTPNPGNDQGYGRGAPPVGGVPVGSAGSVDPYGRNANPDDVDTTQFLTNPGEVLKKRDQRLLNEVGNLVGNVVANAMAVNEFKARNRDLVPHERVVQSFMKDLDPRQFRSISERLDRAGQMAREYLTNVRGGPSGVPNAVPQGANYVEPPTGGDQGGGYMPPGVNPDGTPIQQGGPNQVSAEEKELLDYIAERNAHMNATFGIDVK